MYSEYSVALEVLEEYKDAKVLEGNHKQTSVLMLTIIE